jgi:hypothetical protein
LLRALRFFVVKSFVKGSFADHLNRTASFEPGVHTLKENRTIAEIQRLYASGAAKPSDIVSAALDQIEQENPRLNAFLTINRADALQRAQALDANIQQVLQEKPLAGIPIAIKDNMCTVGLRTTCASQMLGNYVPPYTATAVAKLEEAGAIIIGKTNLDEFAMGGSNENSAFGPARNPHNEDYVPGGSSGGSAIAVAAGLVPVALNSPAGFFLRRRGLETNLRPRLALRPGRLRLFARSDRPLRPHGGRCRPRVASHRRARPLRRHFGQRGSARLPSQP